MRASVEYVGWYGTAKNGRNAMVVVATVETSVQYVCRS